MNTFSLKYPFTISMSDVDMNGEYRLNLLMNQFTHVALENSLNLNMWSEAMYGHYGWVVAKQQLTLEEPIYYGDSVEIETMPGKGSFVSFPRYYFIYKNGKKIGECSSIWTLIDLEKRSIVSPKKLGLNFPEMNHGIKLPTPKIITSDHFDHSVSRCVHYEDVDTNYHMNNTRHISWGLDLLGCEFLKTHRVLSISIQYKKEIAPETAVTLKTVWQGDTFIVEGEVDQEIFFTMNMVVSSKG